MTPLGAVEKVGGLLAGTSSGECLPRIDKARLFRYQLPLRFPLPLKSTRLTLREGLLLELTDSLGSVAYGEAAPLPDFSMESLEQARSVVVRLCSGLISPASVNVTELQESGGASASFAIGSAIWGLGRKKWTPRPAVAPLLLGSEFDICQRLQSWQKPWPAEFKVKVGRCTVSDDVRRIHSILQLLPEGVSLRIDANQRWQLDQALSFAEGLGIGNDRDALIQRIAYIEEPSVYSKDFPAFFQATGIGYALDESLHHQPANNFMMAEGLRALVIKPTLIGWASSQALIQQARNINIRVILSSSFESIVGIHCLQQLCEFWTPGEMPGLDTLSAFSNNVVNTMPDPGQSLPEQALNALELLWEANRS